MPEGDLVLAKPPAEQHLFLSAPGGKVDEALVEILDENTERAQRLDGVRNLRRLALDHSAQLVDLVPKLDRILRAHGVERATAAIRRALEAEGKVYAAGSIEAHEPVAFATLQREC